MFQFPIAALSASSEPDLFVTLCALAVCLAWVLAMRLIARKSNHSTRALNALSASASEFFVERRKVPRGFCGMNESSPA